MGKRDIWFVTHPRITAGVCLVTVPVHLLFFYSKEMTKWNWRHTVSYADDIKDNSRLLLESFPDSVKSFYKKFPDNVYEQLRTYREANDL